MSIRYVKQLDDYGCAIACIAMVLGITYNEVKKDFLPVAYEDGMSLNSALEYIADHGRTILLKSLHSYNHKDDFCDEFLRPFAPVHILSLKMKANQEGFHMVVMDDQGRILCPQGKTPNYVVECYKINACAGICL